MNKNILRYFLKLQWVGIFVAIQSSLAAQVSPVSAKLPAEDFARIPARAGLSFSPDGKHFAIIAEYQGRQALDVIDFAQMEGKSYFGGSDADVVGFRWLTNDLIQLRTGKVGTRLSDLWYGNYALLYLSISGKSLDYMPGGVRPVRNVPGSDTDLIVDNDGRLDIIDSITGSTKARLRANVPGAGKLGWVIDKSMNLGHPQKTDRKAR